MIKRKKKLNKGLMIVIIGFVMTLFSVSIMSLWVNNFESKKVPLKTEQLNK